MCPACLATLLLTAGGTGTATGLLVLAVKSLTSRPIPTNSKTLAIPTQPTTRPQGDQTR